jgi:hypothetical protein
MVAKIDTIELNIYHFVHPKEIKTNLTYMSHHKLGKLYEDLQKFYIKKLFVFSWRCSYNRLLLYVSDFFSLFMPQEHAKVMFDMIKNDY